MAVAQFTRVEGGIRISADNGTPIDLNIDGVNGDKYTNLTNGDKWSYKTGWVRDESKIEYVVSFVEVEQVLELIGTDMVIDSITESVGVDTLTVDINGGGFAAPSPPIALSVGDEVTWQTTYTGGHDKASINVKGTI